MEVPSELHKECEREFWAAKQTLRRASMARDAAWEALAGLYDYPMWEAFHLPCIPPNFRHWRDRERDEDSM
jgi:hypothetical protein